MQEQAIFTEALEREDPAERAAFLDGACAGDSPLRQRIEKLIGAHDLAGSFLEHPVMSGDATAYCQPLITEQPGAVIGPYKLLEQIGEGGMGVVFMADQERPVKRRVALKVIKPGMDTRQVIARFEAERQALAMMDHPNIAKVFDAGTTDAGRPYFVMELVQGVPITEYCDQCNLTTRERIELFFSACQAMQHAHQKGIIHRDIKPSNVLVAIQDGQPAPKIIDFGVAKAIDQRLTEHTLMTAFAQMVGTPLYMSPEQAELSALGVDTRSDIYSLGVLLYELLTGITPFDKDRLHAASYDELRRIIREEEPPRPSARISTFAADLATTVAEHRRTDSRRLGQTVRGELDWIVMKCLEKDRNRRYDSAGSLAQDVERYLHDEPVQACPPSTVYRLRKYARRNRALLAAGSAITAALVVGLVLSAWQYFRATRESARAKAVSGLLQEMLGSADASQAKGSDYTVRELLSDFSVRLGNQLAGQPEAEADVHATMARAFRSLLLPHQAEPHFEKAIRLRRQVDGSQHENLAALSVDYAWNLHDQSRYAEAEAELRRALEIYNRRGITGAPRFHALEILQHVLISAGRNDDAERVTQQALAVARSGPEEAFDKASLLHRFAGLRNQQDRFVDAEKLAREAVDLHRRQRGDQHPETAWALSELATALQGREKLPEAESAYRESLAIFRRCYGDSHERTRSAHDSLKSVLTARGDAAAIEALASDQAELASRSGSPAHHLRVAGILLADSPSKDARKAEARRLVRRALDEYGQIAANALHNKDRSLEAIDGYLAVAQLCLTDPDFTQEIDEAYHKRTDELKRLLAEFPDSVALQFEAAFRYRHWAFLVAEIGRCTPQYESSLRQAISLFEGLSRKDPKRRGLWFYLASTCVYFGDVTWASAKLEDAESAFRRAMEIYDRHGAEVEKSKAPNDIWEIVRLYSCVGYYLSATDRAQQAADYVGRAARNAERLADPTALADSLYYVALMQARLGDTAGYRATCETIVGLPMSEIEPLGKLRLIWTPCLLPGALQDPSVPVKLAEEYLASNPLNELRIGPYLLGSTHCRASQFEQAAEQLEEAIETYSSGPPLGTHSINSLQLLLAMAKWELGQRDAARDLLSKALPAVEEELQNPTSLWNRRATLELLRDEANALIESTDTSESDKDETHPADKSGERSTRPTSF